MFRSFFFFLFRLLVLVVVVVVCETGLRLDLNFDGGCCLFVVVG